MQDKAIKKGSDLKEIEIITGMSRSTYYRINKEIKAKGSTYWKILESNNNE